MGPNEETGPTLGLEDQSSSATDYCSDFGFGANEPSFPRADNDWVIRSKGGEMIMTASSSNIASKRTADSTPPKLFQSLSIETAITGKARTSGRSDFIINSQGLKDCNPGQGGGWVLEEGKAVRKITDCSPSSSPVPSIHSQCSNDSSYYSFRGSEIVSNNIIGVISDIASDLSPGTSAAADTDSDPKFIQTGPPLSSVFSLSSSSQIHSSPSLSLSPPTSIFSKNTSHGLKPLPKACPVTGPGVETAASSDTNINFAEWSIQPPNNHHLSHQDNNNHTSNDLINTPSSFSPPISSPQLVNLNQECSFSPNLPSAFSDHESGKASRSGRRLKSKLSSARLAKLLTKLRKDQQQHQPNQLFIPAPPSPHPSRTSSAPILTPTTPGSQISPNPFNLLFPTNLSTSPRSPQTLIHQSGAHFAFPATPRRLPQKLSASPESTRQLSLPTDEKSRAQGESVLARPQRPQRSRKLSFGQRIARHLSFSSRKSSAANTESPDLPPPLPLPSPEPRSIPSPIIFDPNQTSLASSLLPLLRSPQSTEALPAKDIIGSSSGVLDSSVSCIGQTENRSFFPFPPSSAAATTAALSLHACAPSCSTFHPHQHRPQPTRSKSSHALRPSQTTPTPVPALPNTPLHLSTERVSPLKLDFFHPSHFELSSTDPSLQEADILSSTSPSGLTPPPFDQTLLNRPFGRSPSILSNSIQLSPKTFQSKSREISPICAPETLPPIHSSYIVPERPRSASLESSMSTNPPRYRPQPPSLQQSNDHNFSAPRRLRSCSETEGSTTSGGGGEESDDDDDDVPLGQSHPDALKVQASLRAERARRRATREAEKAEALKVRQQREKEESQRRTDEEQRNLDLAAATAKLTMRRNDRDEDDNKPLGLIQRQKSVAKPSFRDPFAIAPEALCQRLELLRSAENERDPIPRKDSTTAQTEPVGHPLLPQTDASVRSRKQSTATQRLEPLSPFIQESVLTMGDDGPQFSKGFDAGETLPTSTPINGGRRPSRPVANENPLVTELHSRQNTNQSISTPSNGARRPSRTAANESPSVNELHLRQNTNQPAASSYSPLSNPREPLHATPSGSKSSALKRNKTQVNSSRKISNEPVESPLSQSHGQNSGKDSSPAPRRGKTISEKSQPQESYNESMPAINPNQWPPNSQMNSGVERSRSVVKRPPALTLAHTNPEAVEPLAKSPVSVHSPINLKPNLLIKVGIVHQSNSMIIEIGEETSVNDLLKQAESAGELKGEGMTGSWGVFEVWKELGIERPIRESETVMSVVKTWTAVDTNEAHLLIKRDDLSGLAVSKRSVTSGVFGGNLWCELKPGKWTKKYVVLRDNGVYLCSNEKGKDEMFLCTLTKFDVYQVPTWAQDALKPPREHAFGLKSLDKLSFFETKTDFVHKFCCKDRLRQLEWIRRLYDARTFHLMLQGSFHDEAASSSAMNRMRSADTSASRLNGDRNKVGIGRSGTLAGPSSRKKITEPESELGSSKKVHAQYPTPAGASGLTRKATLINPESLSNFRQGTLLGNLGSNNSNTQANGSTAGGRPVLPPHVMPLNSSEVLVQEEKGGAGLPSVTMKARTWEQMGSQERKDYLLEVQNRAKAEGRTLLKFEPDGKLDNFAGNNGGGLLRSRTIAGDRKKKM